MGCSLTYVRSVGLCLGGFSGIKADIEGNSPERYLIALGEMTFLVRLDELERLGLKPLRKISYAEGK